MSKNKKLTEDERNVIREYIKSGMSTEEIIKRTKVSRSTVNNYIRKYKSNLSNTIKPDSIENCIKIIEILNSEIKLQNNKLDRVLDENIELKEQNTFLLKEIKAYRRCK
ncbi:hypothetical protein JCM1393_21370 [Clostridium carnis]